MSGDEPGHFWTRWMIVDYAMTGHMRMSKADCMVIMSNWSPFFWSSKVMETYSEE